MDKKVALIVGCSIGIGTTLVDTLIKNDFELIITYYNNKNLVSTYKNKALVLQCDVTNEDSIINMYQGIKKQYKHIDLLINNVGIDIGNNIYDKTKDEFIKTLDTNIVGPFLIIKNGLDLLNESIIINISSTDGIYTYNEYNIDYAVSKAGLIQLTKSLVYALPNNNFYTIAPNYVNTESIKEMNPEFLKNEMKRIGQAKLIEPDEISKVVLEILNGNKENGSLIILRGDNNE